MTVPLKPRLTAGKAAPAPAAAKPIPIANPTPANQEPYSAYPITGDRLQRFAILGTPQEGQAKPVMAVNIKTLTLASLFASAPTMRDKLIDIAMECNGAVAGSSTAPATAAQLAIAILAIINPPAVATPTK